MTIWIDAQRSPALATWVEARFALAGQPALIVDGWSPEVVASRAMGMALARSLHLDVVAARGVLTKLTGEKFWRLNADYRMPVVGIERIGELCVVTLRLDEKSGMYSPVKILRYRRKAEPPAGAGPVEPGRAERQSAHGSAP